MGDGATNEHRMQCRGMELRNKFLIVPEPATGLLAVYPTGIFEIGAWLTSEHRLALRSPD
jgi:hypothetical protein